MFSFTIVLVKQAIHKRSVRSLSWSLIYDFWLVTNDAAV